MKKILQKKYNISPTPAVCSLTWSQRPTVQVRRNEGYSFKGARRNRTAVLVLLALLFSSNLNAAEINLAAVSQIESSNNLHAFNSKDKSVGLFQITPICLKDYNQTHKTHYLLSDLFSPDFNKEVASWYLNARIPQLLARKGYLDSVFNRLIAFNCGISCIGKPLPRITQNYLKKYEVLNG